MPGSIIVRPIEANLTHSTELIGKMNPYCAFNVGGARIRSQVCKKGGKHPVWNDAVTLPLTNESKILVEVMDKDKITKDDNIGSCMLDVNEVQASGHVSKWYPLYYKNKVAGEILLEAVVQPGAGSVGQGQFSQGQQQLAGAGVGPGIGTGVGTGVGAGMASGQSQYAGAGTGMTSGQSQYAGTGMTSGQDQYAGTGMTSGQNQYYAQENLLSAGQSGMMQNQGGLIGGTSGHASTMSHQGLHATDTSAHSHSHVWTEQRQSVESHTFMKEVDVVETRSAMKEIETMEPVRVLKDVEYTQAVPVRKQIELAEPQVVLKDVEVMEPRLVTKTIQVIENVPVHKQVEVIEMRNTIQEVESFEPQTFHKQVEVTEFHPARRQVEVTQPFTVKKAVEFVEPVITTQTITKELQEPVIIDQRITTEVGPASIIGWTNEYIVQEFGNLSLATDTQRLGGHQRWVGYETIFGGLTDQERLWEQQRLSRLNEQEWLAERQRLMGFSEKDRLTHQRGLFARIKQALGMSSGQKYQQGYGGTGSSRTGLGNTGMGSTGATGLGHTSNYNQSPNF